MKNAILTLLMMALVATSLCPSPAFAKRRCEQIFGQSGDIVIAKSISDRLTNSVEISKRFGTKARGYVIISAAMVSSAAVSAHLTSALPSDMAFLSHLVSQVATIGIYVLGAPIWEPISSAFRKFAFGLNQLDTSAVLKSDPELESLWRKTQGHYSQNAQMSRNLIQSFLIAAHGNFTSARIAMRENEPQLAVEQISEMAIRMRRLFHELDPQDASVALAVRSTFTRHVAVTDRFKSQVFAKIQDDDPDFSEPEAQAYYAAILSSWLD